MAHFSPFQVEMTKDYSLDLVRLTPKNIGQVRVLNQHCFPVVYRDSFYEQLLPNTEYTRLGYFADCLVATIGCKIESKRMYIMTLGVLSEYRRFGFGSQLLSWATENAISEKLSEIALHVQTNNLVALDFYKKHSFVVKSEERDYYPQLSPSSAFYLVKRL